MFAELTVELGSRTYPIYVGQGLLRPDCILKKHIAGKQIFIVTNETIAALYLAQLRAALPHGCRIDEHIIPDGECYKTLESYSSIMDDLIRHRHNRSTTIIALGGGVVGDVAGFVAATYQRGVNYIQVPTTLLAQVDSSVGGKTAVNHPGGKNLIGSFHQPVCVLTDVAVLQTLPEREYLAGLAEAIKYAPVIDATLFVWLESQLKALLARDCDAISHLILQCCRLKAQVVAEDERESGIRAILNFGHTFGHALEKLTHYDQFLHGEAVAIGMNLAAELSCQVCKLAAADAQRLKSLLLQTGLPSALPSGLVLEDFLAAMGMDKKVVDGNLRLVLLNKLGHAVVADNVALPVLQQLLESAGCTSHG